MGNNSVSLKEELFVVLIPEGKILEIAQKLQKKISDHYNIYPKNSYPQIHLTINKVKKHKKNKLIEVTNDLINKWNESIKIYINDFDCYYLSHNNNFLVLKIEESESLKRFSYLLHEKLKENNLSTIENYTNWDFHITIISNIFADNPLNDKDFHKICFILNDIRKPDLSRISSQISKMEIWKPVLDEEEKCLTSYSL